MYYYYIGSSIVLILFKKKILMKVASRDLDAKSDLLDGHEINRPMFSANMFRFTSDLVRISVVLIIFSYYIAYSTL